MQKLILCSCWSESKAVFLVEVDCPTRVSPGTDENPPLRERLKMAKQPTAKTAPTLARADIGVPDQSDVKHVLYSHYSL